MNDLVSKMYRILVGGPLACFTMPHFKAERVSWPVMTPTAARGILDAIWRHPGTIWKIHKISILKPIRWASICINGVNLPENSTKAIYSPDKCQQLRRLVLQDVEYCVHATINLIPPVEKNDNRLKFENMFERRIMRGKAHQAPVLGSNPFMCSTFTLVKDTDNIQPQKDINMDLGQMVLDFDYCKGKKPQPFHAIIKDGVLVTSEAAL